MANTPVAVVDTNVLVNLMTPVVDGRPRSPTGGDPYRAVVSVYDVHIPARVLGEISEMTGSGDLLSAAADAIIQTTRHLTVHDLAETTDRKIDYGLDEGETHAIWLANELGAAMFVTDEFNTTNYLLISLALDDRNSLFTTPHVLCRLASTGVLNPSYVDALLTYYLETKQWDRAYIDQLRAKYLD